MSFMDTIKSLFSPESGSTRRNSRTYVVDGARLVDEKTGRRMAPREQVQLLNSLARVAKQESLDIQVVFESDRPLREVEHGGEFNGVKVFFAPDNEQLVALALKMCRSGNCTLVSSGVTMESRATEAGISVLCSSTFRKAFLQGGLPSGSDRGDRGGQGGGDRGDRDRRRGRDRRRDRGDRDGDRGGQGGGDRGGNRSPREDGQSQNAQQEPGSGESNPPSEGQASEGGDNNSSVRNLIDLVE